MKKIAIVLSGCGHKDGTEITEAVSLIVNLTELGARLSYFAPTQSKEDAAKITRTEVSDLENLNAKDFDGLAMPGGYGAAKYLCDWADKGSQCTVHPALAKAIKQFHKDSKPIAAICIAPVIVARVLGDQNVTVTIGDDKATAMEIEKTGATHETCPVTDYISDRNGKIITTPAYMYDEAKPSDVYKGISGLAKELMEMA